MLCKTFDEFIKEADIVTKHPDECWEWTRSKSGNGYGQAYIITGKHFGVTQYKAVRAHRLAFELFHNCRLASNLQIRHTCDNSGCVNVKHMILGKNQDNINDKVLRNRQKHTITRLQRKEIIDLFDSGKYSRYTLGKMYKVSPKTVGKIINKKGVYADIND